MLWWVIAVLVVLNLSTVLTVLINRNMILQKKADPAAVLKESEGNAVKYSGRYFRDQLGLTREQMERFAEFNPGYRQEVRNIHAALVEKRSRLLQEMSSPDSDTARLDMISDSIGHLHADLKRCTYKYYLNIKAVCDDQQQIRLENLFNEMFAGELQSGPGGTAGQGAGRHGRQVIN